MMHIHLELNLEKPEYLKFFILTMGMGLKGTSHQGLIFRCTSETVNHPFICVFALADWFHCLKLILKGLVLVCYKWLGQKTNLRGSVPTLLLLTSDRFQYCRHLRVSGGLVG